MAPSASCKTYTFEGLPDRNPIPPFDGISANGWDSGISETQGGTAQFINAPSGITVAVFLGGGTDTITFTNPVQSVQYYYATAYATTLTAYDSNGTVVAGPVQIQPNWDGNPAGYEVWTQIASLQAAGNVISSLSIQSAAVLNNFLGIDNLDVCTSLTINSVEMTQAIQQFQVLGDLKNSLSSAGEPPVPIISGKPGVMRIYVNPPLDSTTVSMEVSGPGSFDEIKQATLQPGCQPSDQRVHNRSCPSTDFYFTPPSGTWTSTVSVRDSGGALLEQEALTFRSRDTQPLVVRGVSVCDFLIEGNWICGHASDIVGKTGVLEKIAPTNSVTTSVSSHFTRREIAPYCPNGSPGSCAGNWWEASVRDISRFYFRFQSLADINGNMRTQLSGIVRNDIPGGIGGIAAAIPGYAVMTRSSTPRFTPSVDTIQETLAHEHGHALGLKHTNSGVPQNPATPGCYWYAQDPSTNWPWKGVITVNNNGQVD
ncbi:MAG TPA: hypothetical protein VHW09_30390 [Bryobacteraceae bacterium]|nr:hypothetical protein [Bryobacteraceae bacterium]